jgi:hypothetical protein
MKLLLDDNIPKRLKVDFPGHEVYAVRERGWNGIKNGKLLELMIESGFHAFLTFDKNLQHQQNFKKFSIIVFVLSAVNNTYVELTKFSEQINSRLNNQPVEPGIIIIK